MSLLVAELAACELLVVFRALDASDREDDQTEQTLRQNVGDGVAGLAKNKASLVEAGCVHVCDEGDWVYTPGC